MCLSRLSRELQPQARCREKRWRQVTVDLVDNVKTAVAAGRFSSPDGNDSTTVEFWARSVFETFEEAAQLRKKEQPAATGAAGLAGESAAAYQDFRARRANAMLEKAKVANGEERVKILDIIIAATGAAMARRSIGKRLLRGHFSTLRCT